MMMQSEEVIDIIDSSVTRDDNWRDLNQVWSRSCRNKSNLWERGERSRGMKLQQDDVVVECATTYQADRSRVERESA